MCVSRSCFLFFSTDKLNVTRSLLHWIFVFFFFTSTCVEIQRSHWKSDDEKKKPQIKHETRNKYNCETISAIKWEMKTRDFINATKSIYSMQTFEFWTENWLFFRWIFLIFGVTFICFFLFYERKTHLKCFVWTMLCVRLK